MNIEGDYASSKITLDESENSQLLGDINRSGVSTVFTREGGFHPLLSRHFSGFHATMQEAKADEGQEATAAVQPAVATPASLHENLDDRAAAAGFRSMPPLPMMVTTNAAAAAVAAHISPPTPMPPQVGIAAGGCSSGFGSRSGFGATMSTTTSVHPGTHAPPAGGAHAGWGDNLAAAFHPPNTPATTARSQDSRTLAELYQSSRRSRNSTPRTPSGAGASPSPSGGCPLPPPPLYAAPPPPQSRPSGSMSTSIGSDAHKVSFRASCLFKESWNTSMSSLMNSNSSFMDASLMSDVYQARSSAAARGGGGFDDHQAASARGIATTGSGPALARLQQPSQRRPNLMDYKIEDVSNRRLSAASSHPSSPTASRDEHRMAPDDGDEDENPPDEDEMDRGTHSMPLPTVPNLSGEKKEEEEDLSVGSSRDRGSMAPSSPAGCAEGLSRLQVRSREEFERKIGGSSRCDDIKRGSGVMGDGDDAHDEDFSRASSGGGGGGGGEGDAEADGASGADGEPPKKRNRKQGRAVAHHRHDHQHMRRLSSSAPPPPPLAEGHLLTPHTTKSTASFDIIAHPSSHVSSIHDPDEYCSPFHDVEVDDLLRRCEGADGEGYNGPGQGLYEVDAGEDHKTGVMRMQTKEGKAIEDHHRRRELAVAPASSILQEGGGYPRNEEARHEEGPSGPRDEQRRESPSEKGRRILRRKVQRLLLIRHCSTCPVVPRHHGASSSSSPPSSYRCPVTSHCAEGKALCAHIRVCRLGRACAYKKCLTSREVLGHYRNCTDASCEICGPIRALDALDRRNRDGGGGEAQRGGDHDDRGRRGSDSSSIETIDDEGWLNTNIGCCLVSGTPAKVGSAHLDPDEEGR